MAIQTYSLFKDSAKKLSAHFLVGEFASRNGSKLYSNMVLIDTGLVSLLERLYSAISAAGYKVCGIYITSGYRTREHDKAVGGRGAGPHTKGIAADINVKLCANGEHVINRGGTYWLDGKYICCLAQDMGVEGIGYIGGRAVHLDTRTKRWWGDETNGKSVADWYSYFGIQRTGAPDVQYQVYAAGKWLPWVTNDRDYAGIRLRGVSGLRAKLSAGHVQYRAHASGKWLPWVQDAGDYAGIIGKSIDGIQMRLVGVEGYTIQYRVSSPLRDYYPRVTGDDDFAGVFGRSIDRVQCRIVKK